MKKNQKCQQEIYPDECKDREYLPGYTQPIANQVLRQYETRHADEAQIQKRKWLRQLVQVDDKKDVEEF